MFSGLSAFPLTPLESDHFDEAAYRRLVSRLVDAGVDSIGALGSTGSYAYLNRSQRKQVAQATRDAAPETAVLIGIGAPSTAGVLALAEDAQNAGADALLLAPVSYQQLSADEVFGLYERVCAEISVPLAVYDNPGTTHFSFDTELYARIAALPPVAAIKIPPTTLDPYEMKQRVAQLRRSLPADLKLGISGDGYAATALNVGCDLWFSAIAGILPEQTLGIVRAAEAGDSQRAMELSNRLQPLWQLIGEYGSLRVSVAVAELLGFVAANSLPAPLRTLAPSAFQQVATAMTDLGVLPRS